MNALSNFLQDALAKNNEFEIRFGRFYQDRSRSVDGKSHTVFDSTMEIDSFYRLKRMFETQGVEKVVTKTREYIYPTTVTGTGTGTHRATGGSIKRIVNLDDGSETTMMKQTIRKYDVYDYDLRMSVAYERKGVVVTDTNAYNMIREKSRTSFALPFGSLDLTVVVQQDVQKSTYFTKYEVEMEITRFDERGIMGYLMIVLQNRQDNFYVISGTEKRRVISQYRDLVGCNYFVGAQPESLHKERIGTLYKTEYSVTDKADGDRALMIVDDRGCVYFVDNNLNRIFKTDVVSKNHGTVLDGEIVKTAQSVHFLAFDVLVSDNSDIRGNREYTLRKRLDVVGDVIKNTECTDYYKISAKRYYFGNVFTGAKCILDSVSEKFYGNDGLVFTPVNDPYPRVKKWSGLLKWKPPHLNTIDFYAKRVTNTNNHNNHSKTTSANSTDESGNGTWELYVQANVQTNNSVNNNNNTTGNANNRRTQKVLFDVSKLCNEETRIVTYETSFSDDLCDPTTGEKYTSGTVIEFSWDTKAMKFMPVRTRWDKTVNPLKHGNYSGVACDIWNTINNPIEADYLLKFYSNVKSSDKSDVYFERMRRFHNRVKEFLYNKYCKNTERLLELCSGRGGDMHKWTFNNVKTVHGYDISERSVQECYRRLESIQHPHGDYKFYPLDLTRSDAYQIVHKNQPDQFDVVCCQFGVHYFFRSEDTFNNFVKILDTNLRTGGNLVVTFMDNHCLDQLFGAKSVVTHEQGDEVVYRIERAANRVTTNGVPFGNRLSITLNGNNVLSEGSDEWIIDFDHFVKTMGERGYQCVETEVFSKLYNPQLVGVELSDYEKEISSLNRYCVFQKTTTDAFPQLDQQVYRIVPTDFDFGTIDLHQKGISVQRITSFYNIVDIVNCIEYRYYKNSVDDFALDDIPERVFPKIQSAFKKLGIIYTPHFVSDPVDFGEYRVLGDTLSFTYHKHIIERAGEISGQTNLKSSTTETLEYHNWYIIMHNDQLIFNLETNSRQDLNTLKSEPVQPVQPVESIQPVEPVEAVEAVQPVEAKQISVKDEYAELQRSGTKITIRVLKALLQQVGLKTGGKREELQTRLEEFLQNN